MLLFKRADEVEVGDRIDLQAEHQLFEVLGTELLEGGWTLLKVNGFEFRHRDHDRITVVVSSDAEILRHRFLHDVCLDCGRDESGHEVERDRYGDVVVRCVHRGHYVEV